MDTRNSTNAESVIHPMLKDDKPNQCLAIEYLFKTWFSNG